MSEARTDTGPGRVRRSAGVVAIQGLNSLTTVVQMVLFAVLLPRQSFDEYAVWFTSAAFLVGIGQAMGSDRVVIGRRSPEDGTSSARVLALVVGVAQLAVAAALSSVPLLVCSLAAFVFVFYDQQRMVRCFDEPRYFLRRDLVVLAAQVATVLLVFAVVGSSPWVVVGWWGVGLPLWWVAGGRVSTRLRDGVAVLRADARESLPLLVDAVLAGVPMVIALALAHAQGSEGTASAARMALTILGPVTVVALAGRRLIYARVASGRLGARFAVQWAGVVAASVLLCAGLLVVTRTPLYPWAFPGFEALGWIAILGFALNHSAVIASFLPAAHLRAAGRSDAVGLARVAAASASGVVGLLVAPFDSPGDVGWCVGAGSIAYAIVLYAVDLVPSRRRTPSVTR